MSLIPLIIVISAIFTSFSMSLSALLIMISTLVFFKFSRQKPIVSKESLQQEAAASKSSYCSLPQEKQRPAPEDHQTTMWISSEVENQSEMLLPGRKEEENRKGTMIKCEIMDGHSSSDTYHEHDHSGIEWLSDMEQKQAEYFFYGSISDEENLIEIEIPSGQFCSQQEEDPYKLKLNCKLSAKEKFQEYDESGFKAYTGELSGDQEDNLIEIDIYMGSIKCS
ncbi:hypothetical protein F511_34120 [Dorcoceras hygrometricum]|uniref:Uncharacterized protein n=1 Tax=Dorcoceras hygrometricum TaxID=472368 RepID=A0A2Z7A3E4_9LAMI|nr:hypothetical protein F511_34120 [Dorcoceras hygrometricum]